MSENLKESLASIEFALAKIENPRVACENKCVRTITLQCVQHDDSDDPSPRWSCDASVECGYGNEHFCRFVPLMAEGVGSHPAEAAMRCRVVLEPLVAERRESQEMEEELEDF
jgi:hypothetical protein